MSLPIRGRGGRRLFRIGPKNTHWIEDVEILPPVKFHWIPFSGFRREVKNVSVNQGRVAILFFRSVWKKNPANLEEVFEMLLPVKFCWIPFSGFIVRDSLPLYPLFISAVETADIKSGYRGRESRTSGFRTEVKNVSTDQRPVRPSCFSDRPEKHKLGWGHWDISSCQVSLNSVQRFQKRSKKCLSQSANWQFLHEDTQA